MVAYLGYTLRMRTLFRGWPIMVNDMHTRRRRLQIGIILLPPPHRARSWTVNLGVRRWKIKVTVGRIHLEAWQRHRSWSHESSRQRHAISNGKVALKGGRGVAHSFNCTLPRLLDVQLLLGPVYCVLCTVYCVLCTVYCVLRTVYCVLRTAYCVLCTVYCAVFICSCSFHSCKWTFSSVGLDSY